MYDNVQHFINKSTTISTPYHTYSHSAFRASTHVRTTSSLPATPLACACVCVCVFPYTLWHPDNTAYQCKTSCRHLTDSMYIYNKRAILMFYTLWVLGWMLWFFKSCVNNACYQNTLFQNNTMPLQFYISISSSNVQLNLQNYVRV